MRAITTNTPAPALSLLYMMLLLVAFLTVQRWIDRSDPKLAGDTLPDRDLVFE